MRSFCRKNHVRKIPPFRGGSFGGGGECPFCFYGRADFSDSYRAIPVAIVSQNSFVLVFVGVSHNYRAIRCKMGYRTDVRV